MTQTENSDLEASLDQLSKATHASKARILKALGETACEKLRPGDHASYLAQSNEQTMEAIKRLLDGSVQPTLGPECSQCPLRV
jgi:transcriptional regulator of NAD metabolism